MRCSPLSMPPREAEDKVSGTAFRYLHWPGRVAVSDEHAWFRADLKKAEDGSGLCMEKRIQKVQERERERAMR